MATSHNQVDAVLVHERGDYRYGIAMLQEDLEGNVIEVRACQTGLNLLLGRVLHLKQGLIEVVWRDVRVLFRLNHLDDVDRRTEAASNDGTHERRHRCRGPPLPARSGTGEILTTDRPG